LPATEKNCQRQSGSAFGMSMPLKKDGLTVTGLTKLQAFDTLFNKRDYKAAERYWSSNYIQHSAHIPPGRDALFNLVRSMPASLKYEPGVIRAESDYLIVQDPCQLLAGWTGLHPFPAVMGAPAPNCTRISWHRQSRVLGRAILARF
jgi:hypothetical protein